MPSRVMSTASGAVPGRAAPTAWTMRPQLGSALCSAVLTSGELATPRAAASTLWQVSSAHDHACDAGGALAVFDHQDRELAQQRVERLAEAQLVLALGLDAHAGGAGGHEDGGVVGGELTVDGGAVEGALDAYAEQQVGRVGLAARRRSARSRTSWRSSGRSCPRPCIARSGGRGLRRARPVGRRASRRRRSSGSPAGSRRRPRGVARPWTARMPFRTESTGRYQLMPPVEASATVASSTPTASAAAPWVLAASSSPRRPVAALAQPEFARIARSESSGSAPG